ncbi:MAG: hypothetical protein JWL95_2441 [Gemmatimonadetes bacterium]|nr:hypothetical protein [Gemmatimonadota bacterium]
MDMDLGVIIGLIGALCTAGILGLSYMGAYMLGRTRGRSEVELERRVDQHDDARVLDHDRVLMVESAVVSMAQAIERLTDAQRIALLERVRAANEGRGAVGRVPQHNTPA